MKQWIKSMEFARLNGNQRFPWHGMRTIAKPISACSGLAAGKLELLMRMHRDRDQRFVELLDLGLSGRKTKYSS
jgi:hypothetical protein